MRRSRKNSKNSMKFMTMVKYDDVVEEELEELSEGHDVVVMRRRGHDVEEELKELDEGHDCEAEPQTEQTARV